MMLLMFVSGAIFTAIYSEKYEALASNPEYLNIKLQIQNQTDIDTLKKTALHLHASTINSAKDNNVFFNSLSKIFITLSVLIVLLIAMFYKYTISNSTFKRDTEKAPRPLT